MAVRPEGSCRPISHGRPPTHRPDLRDFARLTEPVEPRGERLLQGRRDRLRAALRAALEQESRHLLDEQWDAARSLAHSIDHLVGERMPACDLPDHFSHLRAVERRERNNAVVRAHGPGCPEFRPRGGDDQQRGLRAALGEPGGRDFSYPLLRDVSSSAAGFDELRLQAALDRLTEGDLLFVDGAPPTAAYRFKHALIQDAAYESLLRSRRQALHRRAAEALRDANAEPEAIAHHFTEAGLDDLAIEWWGKAGDQALRRSAFQEAIAHLGKAIAMADKAGDAASQQARGGPVAPNRRLTLLHVVHGNALYAARGHGAPETTQAFAKARASASGDRDAPER